MDNSFFFFFFWGGGNKNDVGCIKLNESSVKPLSHWNATTGD